MNKSYDVQRTTRVILYDATVMHPEKGKLSRINGDLLKQAAQAATYEADTGDTDGILYYFDPGWGDGQQWVAPDWVPSDLVYEFVVSYVVRETGVTTKEVVRP